MTTPAKDPNEDSPLNSKYRPKVLDEVIGHEKVVATLRGFAAKGKFPPVIAFFGPPSAGKTTLAQALATTVIGKPCLKSRDYTEVNCASSRSIDEMRGLIQISTLSPCEGPRRFVMLDEAQGLVSGGGGTAAASALLVPLERPSQRTTWIITSMEPDKFTSNKTGAAMLSRATQFHLKEPSAEEMLALFSRIRKGEGYTFFSRAVREAVIEAAGTQMRTLCNLMSSLAGYWEGLPEADRPDKLSVDDVSEVIEQSSDVDDTTVAVMLSAIYAGDLLKALSVIPSIQDSFKAVNALLNANYYFLATAALGGKRHPKVWGSKVATLVTKHNAMDGLKPSQKLAIFTIVNEQVCTLKQQASSFVVPEMALLSAFASHTVASINRVISRN